jgi:hypothetical protein
MAFQKGLDRRMNNTPWKYSLQFINNHVGEGEIFFTIDQLNYVRKYKKVHPSTLFDHRLILEKLGFLEQTHEKGVWLKVKDFPYDVGRSEAEKVAWGKYGWEQWFVPPGWPLLNNQQSEAFYGRNKGDTSSV